MTTIFVDFDGTITERDLLDRIAEHFGDPDVYASVDRAIDEDSITLHEALRQEFEPVTAPLDQVVEWVLDQAVVRPGFVELVELARERGWRLVVLSSGFRELIEPVLEREGLHGLELYANSVDPDPDGWHVRFRDEELCEVCGEPCKRGTVVSLADGGARVYVGDGFSDRCGAKASDLVFARRSLAAHLTKAGVEFEPFEDFFQISERLEPSA